MVRSVRSGRRRIASTSAIGLRRLAHPPTPMVIPASRPATASSAVHRLSAIVYELVPGPVALTEQVQLEGEALLEAVAALHVDRIDAVQRLLRSTDHGRRLGGYLCGNL